MATELNLYEEGEHMLLARRTWLRSTGWNAGAGPSFTDMWGHTVRM
jgi:hypothetical protein